MAVIPERKIEGPTDKWRSFTKEEQELRDLFGFNDDKPNDDNTKTKESKDWLQKLKEFMRNDKKSYQNMKAETDPEKYEQQRDERRAVKKSMEERAKLIAKLRGGLGAEKRRKDAEIQNRRNKQRNPNQGRGYTRNFANNGR